MVEKSKVKLQVEVYQRVFTRQTASRQLCCDCQDCKYKWAMFWTNAGEGTPKIQCKSTTTLTTTTTTTIKNGQPILLMDLPKKSPLRYWQVDWHLRNLETGSTKRKKAQIREIQTIRQYCDWDGESGRLKVTTEIGTQKERMQWSWERSFPEPAADKKRLIEKMRSTQIASSFLKGTTLTAKPED